MVFEHSSYRTFLKTVLLQRAKKNPAYSLRAMARQLGLQPSLLSEVLSGNRQLTDEAAVLVAEKMDLAETERRYFRLLVQLGRAKNIQVKNELLRQLSEIHPKKVAHYDLSVDQFIIISDWAHFAVLRLLDLADFDFNPHAIAVALDIHPYEVEAVLDRLIRLELIEKAPNNKFKKIKNNILVQSLSRNGALKKYHQQMLQKTIECLTTQSPTERFTGTENVCLSREQFAKASDIFEECFQKILRLSEKRRPNAEVYHLGIHMIRLSTARTIRRTKK